MYLYYVGIRNRCFEIGTLPQPIRAEGLGPSGSVLHSGEGNLVITPGYGHEHGHIESDETEVENARVDTCRDWYKW